MDADRQKQLQAFVDYAKTLDGDEKGEAQVFLDRLFRAFSRGGYKEAGARLEERVANDRGGTSFADLVWKPVVLIEMKKRGEDLARHLTQAFDYWVRLVPNRPQYVVLCNFDEFRVYDFNQDINQPQDTLKLSELPQRSGPLDFLWPTNERARFRIDREDATRKAAAKLSAVYQALRNKHPEGAQGAQRFVLQALVCFFAEDIGLLPRALFTDLLEESTTPAKAFDNLNGLFHAMNQREGVAGGRYKGVEYFNGGIFAHSAALELDPHAELAMLREASSYNWSHISPDIFGTIFQNSMDADERHAMGAHYTTQADIMRIVKPTIVDPFTRALSRAGTLKELTALRDRLTSLRVLDPACGSGNFLYIAYREMRRLDAAIISKQSELSKRDFTGQAGFAGVSPRQFFGMDVLPFAVELAKVTLSLAPKLASDELHTAERTLPLANLDDNIKVQDALLTEDRKQTPWPAADIIIGNPPFLGAKRLKPERGADYVNALRKAYPDVPGMADYCVYWFRRAHDHLQPCTAANWQAGRAGLVGTQNIRNNQSRVGGLDHIVASGTIIEAVENMPWSGEANVHVSIANWVKNAKPASAKVESGANASTPRRSRSAKATTPAADSQPQPAADEDAARNLPPVRRLWTKVEDSADFTENTGTAKRPTTMTLGKRGKALKHKSYELAVRDADLINSALSDGVDASKRLVLKCNVQTKRCFQGKIPGYPGFMLDLQTAQVLRRDSAAVVAPYLTGRELLDPFKIERWVIDFGKRNMLEAASMHLAFEHCKKYVLPAVQKTLRDAEGEDSDMIAARKEHLERWWQLWNRRDQLTTWLSKHRRYAACSRVTRRPILVFLCSSICPSDLIQVFAFDDDYSFGVLQSTHHFELFKRSSRMKVESDNRYSSRSVFDTFPWPQSPTKRQVKAVAAAGRRVRTIRAEMLPKLSSAEGGLRGLYRTLELPGSNPHRDAHDALDAAVMDAYGFSARKDLLKQILDLNLSVAAAITKNQPVTAPGVPANYGDPADLITDDCITP